MGVCVVEIVSIERAMLKSEVVRGERDVSKSTKAEERTVIQIKWMIDYIAKMRRDSIQVRGEVDSRRTRLQTLTSRPLWIGYQLHRYQAQEQGRTFVIITAMISGPAGRSYIPHGRCHDPYAARRAFSFLLDP